jgi:hypothetical protein
VIGIALLGRGVCANTESHVTYFDKINQYTKFYNIIIYNEIISDIIIFTIENIPFEGYTIII